jgi:hypothetical protein
MQIEDIVKIKNKLNTKLWNGLELKTDVRKALLKIVDAFLDFSNIKKDLIKDILFVGSNANYNWHEDSDIDLHILLNYKECPDCAIFKVKECVDYIKKDFNENYDIHIYNIPIEIYIQEEDEVLNSSAIYSVKKNSWLKKPTRFETADIDTDKIKEKYTRIKKSLSQLSDYDELDKLFKKIVKSRKTGLKSKGGEFNEDNLLFKMLRSNDLLKKIKEKRNQLLSDELSLKYEKKKA